MSARSEPAGSRPAGTVPAAPRADGGTRPLFLIGRDDPLDAGLERRAVETGYAVRRLELLAVGPGPDLGRLGELLAAPPPGTAIAWTSRRAAEALVRTCLSRASGALPNIPLFALGAESAAPAGAAGLRVEFPDGAAGAGRLAAFISERAGPLGLSRILALRGDRALPDLVAGLRAAGLDVETAEVYRISYSTPDVRDISAAIAEGRLAAAAFFSPSGVEALERVLPGAALTRLRATVAALARGETTYRALTDRGYHRVSAPDSPATPFEAFAAGALRDLRSRSR